jgi:hypothetical protein
MATGDLPYIGSCAHTHAHNHSESPVARHSVECGFSELSLSNTTIHTAECELEGRRGAAAERLSDLVYSVERGFGVRQYRVLCRVLVGAV